MLALVAGLGVAVAYERLKTHPGCFQVQISAYYYTPVRSVLTGVLFALGVCLLCIRGNTSGEDILLNFAGMFAAFSGLVPTPEVDPNCSSAGYVTENLKANIGNNVFALLAIGLVVLAVLARPQRWRELRRRGSLLRQPAVYAYLAAWLVWITTALVLELARGSFDGYAHYVAATLMLLFIFAVVVLNAWAVRERPGANYYAAVAASIAVFSVGFGISTFAGWAYGILGLEISFLTLFAVFWVIQTKELWWEGVRRAP